MIAFRCGLVLRYSNGAVTTVEVGGHVLELMAEKYEPKE
jgi:hypothetical protein